MLDDAEAAEDAAEEEKEEDEAAGYRIKNTNPIHRCGEKTEQFCETSSISELDNVKNEAILRDFLNFRS